MVLAASISAPCCETMGRKKKEGWGGEWSVVVVVAVVGFLEAS